VKLEIHTVEELLSHFDEHDNVNNIVVQGLDLQAHTELLCKCTAAGAVFLGCTMAPEAAEFLRDGGALLFPPMPDLPFEPYRPELYTVAELMHGYDRGNPSSYVSSIDQRIYQHFDSMRVRPEPVPIIQALAQRLHDHAIDNALDEFLHGDSPRRVVAIMGGHSMKRTEPAYRDVARIAAELSHRGYTMASGGGPGAMEATHLGAYLAGPGADEQIDEALGILVNAPDYKHPGWLDTAFDVRDRFAQASESLGVPTWFYGHEPPNLFASHIAKYFSNSLREDGLLAIAKHGVIYSPGSAGTIQEIFMDATQNHYGTFSEVSPMVLLGRSYWTENKPVLPLLRKLAGDRQYASLITICDTVDEAVDYIVNHPPVAYTG